MFTTIVVGSDGSEHAQRAVRWTAQLAREQGAKVVLVHAAPDLVQRALAAGAAWIPQEVIDQRWAAVEQTAREDFPTPSRRRASPTWSR